MNGVKHVKRAYAKRILPLIFTAVLSLGAYHAAFAADISPAVTLDKTSVSTGSAQTVTMMVQLPQTVKAGGYELTCVYPEEFEITSIENDDACVGGSLGSGYYNTENGMIKWFDSDLQDKDLTKLAAVTFRIPAGTPSGTYALGVKNTAIYAERGRTEVLNKVDSVTAVLTLTSGGGSGTGSGSGGSGGSGGGSGGSDIPGGNVTADPAADTVRLIDEIGTVTKDSGDAIAAARTAYDKLSDSDKSKVTNYSVLTAAESAYAALNASGVQSAFTDTQNHWAREAIEFAVGKELFNGTTSTTFEPETAMNRAMLATVIWRLEGEPEAANRSPFNDVSEKAYYADAVAWANANGIVKGYSADRFAPDDNVTREQIAAILYRYAEWKGYDLSGSEDLSGFADSGEISSYAVENLKWAVGAGIINGRTENTLVPKGTATRAEVATMLMRWIQTVGV